MYMAHPHTLWQFAKGLALTLACWLGLGFGGQMAAQANVKLCNETSYVLRVATAYQQGLASKTDGWQVLLPGQCQASKNQIPPQAQAFVYAKSDSSHAGEGLVFDGKERFCVGPEDASFAIEGRRECRKRGYLAADFAPITGTGKQLFVTFTEKADFGSRRAPVAGLQRLLSDLQYDMGKIDGFRGARTSEASAAYRLRYQVKGKPEGEKLLAQLFETTRKQADERGLILCNKTKNLVWAATGRIKGDGFESQGWLRVLPKQCAQAIHQNLTDRFYFYYAEAVTDTGAPVMSGGSPQKWAGDFDMCVKNTRFAITGTQNCEARGYQQHKFVKVDIRSARKWLVNLDEER